MRLAHRRRCIALRIEPGDPLLNPERMDLGEGYVLKGGEDEVAEVGVVAGTRGEPQVDA